MLKSILILVALTSSTVAAADAVWKPANNEPCKYKCRDYGLLAVPGGY